MSCSFMVSSAGFDGERRRFASGDGVTLRFRSGLPSLLIDKVETFGRRTLLSEADLVNEWVDLCGGRNALEARVGEGTEFARRCSL